MKPDYDVTTFETWQLKAEEDFTAASILAEHGGPAATICFLCQQVAEKYLKGYLLLHRQTAPTMPGCRLPDTTSAAKSRRLARLIAEENQQPLGWFFVSFCDNEGPLGAVIVEAHGEFTAAREASKRGIDPLAQGAHPGGDIACTPLDKKDMKRIPADMLNRLIRERELRRRLDGKRANE